MAHLQVLKQLDLWEKWQTLMQIKESILHQVRLNKKLLRQKSQDSLSKFNFTLTVLHQRQMSKLICSSTLWLVITCWDSKSQWRWMMEELKLSHAIGHNISITSNRSKVVQDIVQTWPSKNALLLHHSWHSNSQSLIFHLVEQKEVLDLTHRNIHRENLKRLQENILWHSQIKVSLVHKVMFLDQIWVQMNKLWLGLRIHTAICMEKKKSMLKDVLLVNSNLKVVLVEELNPLVSVHSTF